MRISFTNELADGRILYPIGRLRAASAWHANGATSADVDWKEAALQALIREAEDFEADAIIGIDYEVDDAQHLDLMNVDLQRVTATGIAVKLARN